MTNATASSAILSHLHRADGSATFSQNGYTVIGAVNGPIEVQRRDELPVEAAIDVIVRPAAGVGGTRERHLESILQSTLRQIILIHNFPRTLIQVTLQITNTPEDKVAGSKIVQASSHLAILPTLLQTALLALLSASMPLSVIFTSVLIAAHKDGAITSLTPNPSLVGFESADSVHVLAFTLEGKLLLAESQGTFTLDDWDNILEMAGSVCVPKDGADIEGGVRIEETKEDMTTFVKCTLEAKVAQDLHWYT
ncbi:hypothetical protein BJ875DRAFT_3387 [Amylocarpus encephaloides]|uniref:Exoribonuclease phosphorolytic domain-containing protein n=1 Tax=Amylocarpus encephaloides TaxID=45428 RepID=A0A9P7YS23_9HELO|nr:hypothetical protein BJ875DRAFT_3387 [Amylocarpus encephaloides]